MRGITSFEKRHLFREIGKNWQNYALMGPFLALFFLFTLLPVLISIVYSFTYFDIFSSPRFVFGDNYIRMFLDDDVFLIALRNTILFALLTGPIGYFLSFFVAWLISDFGRSTRAILTTLFYAPTLSGQAYTVWLFMFSSDPYGIINGYLMRLGIIKEPVGWLTDPTYVFGVVVFVQLWLSLGTSFLAFMAGLKGIDRSLYEAALVDGIHNRFQEVWYITLPGMKPQLIFGAVMQLISSFSVSDISIRLAGFPSVQYSAETIVTHIMDYGLIRYEMGYACSLAVVLFLIMTLANFLVKALLNRIGS